MPRLKIEAIIDVTTNPNLCKLVDKEYLDGLALTVKNGYDIDDQSREEWKKKNKEAMKLAMQIWEQKNSPFENASNVKYPLLSIAAIQFSSRAYPNIVQGYNVVKTKVVGSDPTGEKAKKASRVQQHMNYQLMEQMEEWEENEDKLLTILPIAGCLFKETYYYPPMGRNISEMVLPGDLVLNYWAKSLETCPRITKKFYLYPNEIEERIRNNLYTKFEYGQAVTSKDEDEDQSTNDEQRPHLFLAQHTYLDLDGDNYQEPYIVTYHYDTQKVVRIVPRFDEDSIIYNESGEVVRIEPDQYFTKFPFIPSLDGSIMDIGFGALLFPINSTVNTTINQLLDSGTQQNSQSGFIGKGINLGRGRGGGSLKLKLNEWLPVPASGDDLRKNIFPLPTHEPSTVLFQLLGFMVEAGEKLSSVTELLMGDQTIQNEPATTSLARIEQGLKVFSAIHKRIFRSSRQEYKKIFILNGKYGKEEDYFTVLDSDEAKQAFRSDYDPKSCDVIPVANPNEVSDTQKLMKAQILFGLRGQGFNDMEINRRFFEAMQVDDVEALMNNPEPPPQDPKVLIEASKLDLETAKFEFEVEKYIDAQAKIQSEIIKNLAAAEASEIGPQLEQYKAEMQGLLGFAKQSVERRKADADNKRRVSGVAGSSGNSGSA
jgi:chaperonin GroES